LDGTLRNIRAVIGGVGVVIAAVSGDDFHPFAAADVFGTFKEKVFEKVGETGFVWVFIFRTHMVHHRSDSRAAPKCPGAKSHASHFQRVFFEFYFLGMKVCKHKQST
jgi:hypothetical protein